MQVLLEKSERGVTLTIPDTLLAKAKITDENIHTATDWGPPVGKEIW